MNAWVMPSCLRRATHFAFTPQPKIAIAGLASWSSYYAMFQPGMLLLEDASEASEVLLPDSVLSDAAPSELPSAVSPVPSSGLSGEDDESLLPHADCVISAVPASAAISSMRLLEMFEMLCVC